MMLEPPPTPPDKAENNRPSQPKYEEYEPPAMPHDMARQGAGTDWGERRDS